MSEDKKISKIILKIFWVILVLVIALTIATKFELF